MRIILWRSWFRILDAVEDKVFLGVIVGRRRRGLGWLVSWGPKASNGYPWLWVKYDVTLRPWMSKRVIAAHERWSRAAQA